MAGSEPNTAARQRFLRHGTCVIRSIVVTKTMGSPWWAVPHRRRELSCHGLENRVQRMVIKMPKGHAAESAGLARWIADDGLQGGQLHNAESGPRLAVNDGGQARQAPPMKASHPALHCHRCHPSQGATTAEVTGRLRMHRQVALIQHRNKEAEVSSPICRQLPLSHQRVFRRSML
jgi:hypothetical protein